MKPNSGSSMPNQGDNRKTKDNNTGKSTKYGASVHKGKSKNTSSPTHPIY